MAGTKGALEAVVQQPYRHPRPEMAATELTQIGLTDKDRIRSRENE